MLDSVLPPASSATPCRLAVGVGLERPWDAAVSLLGGVPTAAWRESIGLAAVPANVRLTAGPLRFAGSRLAAARVGLLESAGRGGEARIEWSAEVVRARFCDPWGQTAAADGDGVAIDGRATVVSLRSHQWRHLEVQFLDTESRP
jgi:hypothetical protein